MLDVVITIFSLLLPETGPERSCMSTIFGQPGDKWAGGDALYLRRPVNATDVGVAHRSLPGLSKVLLINPRNGNVVVAKVVDRGPYGAMVDLEELRGASENPDSQGIPSDCALRPEGKCWYVKKRRSWPGRWRGCLDITPAAAEALGHTGKQRIKYRVIKEGIEK